MCSSLSKCETLVAADVDLVFSGKGSISGRPKVLMDITNITQGNMSVVDSIVDESTKADNRAEVGEGALGLMENQVDQLYDSITPTEEEGKSLEKICEAV